jgi:PAS domain S-box-containing protein
MDSSGLDQAVDLDPRDAERKLLRLCHLAPDTQTLMKELAAEFAAASCCTSVGIRLHEGDDFPYYTTVGFPAAFVRAENELCTRDASGEPLCDTSGNPILECMCGNVLAGRTSPAKPFFTPNGSFWTSSTTELLRSTTASDRQSRTRNRCNGEGYESVALIPLRTGGRTFGLVQFNDSRPGRFSEDRITALEQLVDYVAIALAKFEAEDALRVSEEKFRIVADSTYDWEYWITLDNRVLYMSPSCQRITGYPAEAYRRDPDLRRRIVIPVDRPAWDLHHRQHHLPLVGGALLYRILRGDGEVRWLEHVCQPVLDTDGLCLGVRGSNRDVTDRRQAEEARDRAEGERERLIGQLSEALSHVRTLRGFIPICSACKRIRDDAGYWQAVEVYVRDHTEAEFSHGLCPACAKSLYPDYSPGD